MKQTVIILTLSMLFSIPVFAGSIEQERMQESIQIDRAIRAIEEQNELIRQERQERILQQQEAETPYYPATENAAINPNTGEVYPRAGSGYINPKTGVFYPKAGGVAVNPNYNK